MKLTDAQRRALRELAFYGDGAWITWFRQPTVAVLERLRLVQSVRGRLFITEEGRRALATPPGAPDA